eukprot:GFYU01019455.1.p1 GENE.GFYU01019455.1~~GFYU01019455.1.p1  ORF type:complete len:506 (-),score=197.30 GFYU01019455.1:90-1607(-)
MAANVTQTMDALATYLPEFVTSNVPQEHIPIVGVCTILAVLSTILFFYKSAPLNAPPVAYSFLPFGLDHVMKIVYYANPLTFFRNLYAHYGEVYTVKIFGQRITALIGPEAQAAFFKAPESHVRQREVYSFTVPVFGKNVVYDNEPAETMEQLKFIAYGLGVKKLKSYTDDMIIEAMDFFNKKWATEGTIDLADNMAELIVNTASKTLLGEEIRNNMNEEVAKLYSDLDHGMTPLSYFFPNAPIPSHKARNEARKKMGEIFSKVIRGRREREENPDDFLQNLIAARTKEGKALTDDQISGMLVAGLFAGQHTSTISSTWSLLHIAQDKNIYNKLIAEQKEIMKEYGDRLDIDVLSKMEYMGNVIKEVLRVHPPLVFLMRKVAKAITFKSYTIPAGDVIIVSGPIGMQLDTVYERPLSFEPERFMAPREEDKKQPYAYMGFGGGRHACLGENFGYMQVKTVLSLVLRNFDFEMVGKMPDHDFTALVVGPTKPCQFKYTRKQVPLKA